MTENSEETKGREAPEYGPETAEHPLALVRLETSLQSLRVPNKWLSIPAHTRGARTT